MASSSSMTWMTAVRRHREILLPLTAAQREAKGRAASGVGVRSDPPAMRLDDGAEIDRPTPMPWRLVVTKGWNSCSAMSGAMPEPVSATLMAQHAVLFGAVEIDEFAPVRRLHRLDRRCGSG